MAITFPPLPGGQKSKKWLVTWELDGDTVATIAHGMLGVPDIASFIPLNAQVYIGQVARTSVDADNIVLTKNTALGSGGAQVELIAYGPQTTL